ncbi:MAG: alpha/beta hydrolase family protein [Flavobacteriales bacterium]
MSALQIINGVYQGSAGRKSLFDLEVPTDWNKRVVIFVHGFMGFKDWGAWNVVQSFYVSNGYAFAKLNLTHNGGTEKQGIDFPDLEAFSQNTYSYEVADIRYFRSHLAGIIQAQSTFMVGHSRGGGDVILHANQTQTDKIALWASISDIGSRFPTGSELDQWKNNGIRTIFNGRTKQHLPQRYGLYQDFKENEHSLSIELAIKALKIPILVVHGDQDNSVLNDEGEALARWSETKLEIISGADHVFGASHPWENPNLPEHLLRVCERTLNFFNQ